ncbi:MAG: flavin reductase family protein [Actinomycetota bacterium]
MSIETAVFRSVMGRFATGVTVVTSMLDEAPIAMTANAVASLSLSPPLVLVCADRASLTLRGVRQNRCFSVHVLQAGQQDLAQRFAVTGPKSFDGVPYWPGRSGSPILEDCLAWLDCVLETIHDGGDHEILIGRVEEAEAADGAPLLFYRGAYTSL